MRGENISNTVDDAMLIPIEQTHLQQLKDVVAHIQIRQTRIQHLEIRILHMFKDERGRPRLHVLDQVEQLNDVGTAAQVLENLDLTLDLLLFDRFKDLGACKASASGARENGAAHQSKATMSKRINGIMKMSMRQNEIKSITHPHFTASEENE